jgi:hypothetical protein
MFETDEVVKIFFSEGQEIEHIKYLALICIKNIVDEYLYIWKFFAKKGFSHFFGVLRRPNSLRARVLSPKVGLVICVVSGRVERADGPGAWLCTSVLLAGWWLVCVSVSLVS